MRFVFLITELEQNGPSGSRIRFAEALAKRGHTAEVLTLSSAHQRIVRSDLTVTTLSTPEIAAASGRRRRRLLIEALRRWFESETAKVPIDFLSSSLTVTNRLVHLSGLTDTHHWLHIPIASLRRSEGSWWKRWHRRRADRQTYHNSRVIGVSQGVIDDLAGLGVTPREVDLIYNCFDFTDVRNLTAQQVPDLPAEPFIVHAARFAKAKRHDMLFDAFAAAQIPHKLVLLTEDTLELRALIARYGLEGRVHVAGFQHNPYPFMAAATALVLSSDMEGFPNVLVEALIVGTPVVSTDCLAGPADILTGHYAKWLSPAGDPASLAANLAEIATTPYEIEPWLYERFSMDKALMHLEAIAARGIRPYLRPKSLFGR